MATTDQDFFNFEGATMVGTEIAPELVGDPTYRKHIFMCKTKFFKKNVEEDIGKGIVQRYQRKLVLLIPQESDATTYFLNAWVPEVITEYHELAAELAAPVFAPSRLSIHLGHDEKCDRPYLTVLSKGIEDILVKYPEGTLLKVTALPANEEGEADFAPDSDNGNFDVVQ